MELVPLTIEGLYVPPFVLEELLDSVPEINDLSFSAVTISGFYQDEKFIETSVTFQSQRVIRELERVYIFDNPEEIKSFLLSNDYLLEILNEAPIYICKVFGQVSLHLELHRDPEEGWDELFIVIKSSYSPEKAVMLENRLSEEWFLSRLNNTRGKLNIVEEPL